MDGAVAAEVVLCHGEHCAWFGLQTPRRRRTAVGPQGEPKPREVASIEDPLETRLVEGRRLQRRIVDRDRANTAVGVKVQLRVFVQIAGFKHLRVPEGNVQGVRLGEVSKKALWTTRAPSYPPAMAPMMRNGSTPRATGSGNSASAGSCERSSSQAKKRRKGRRLPVT